MRLFKYCLLNALRAILFRGLDRVILASSGRAGSTMLCEVIATSIIDRKFYFIPKLVRKAIVAYSIDLIPMFDPIISKALVLKTHDLPNPELHKKYKTIFIWANPIDSINSVHRRGTRDGQLWIDEHISNLRGIGNRNELLTNDVLNFQMQMEYWTKQENVLKIQYELLWEHSTVESIEHFLGYKIKLPKQTNRKYDNKLKVDNKLYKHLLSVYEMFDRTAH